MGPILAAALITARATGADRPRAERAGNRRRRKR